MFGAVSAASDIRMVAPDICPVRVEQRSRSQQQHRTVARWPPDNVRCLSAARSSTGHSTGQSTGQRTVMSGALQRASRDGKVAPDMSGGRHRTEAYVRCVQMACVRDRYIRPLGAPDIVRCPRPLCPVLTEKLGKPPNVMFSSGGYK